MTIIEKELIKSLVALQYKRNDQNFYRGTFRARGEYLEIFPSHLRRSCLEVKFVWR